MERIQAATISAASTMPSPAVWNHHTLWVYTVSNPLVAVGYRAHDRFVAGTARLFVVGGVGSLVCVPAGALAGMGFVEFYRGYPAGGYDGGFVGDPVFFGSFLALAQVPFVAVFVPFARSGRPPLGTVHRDGRRGGRVGCGRFFGWTFGSAAGAFLPISCLPVDPSGFYVLGQSLRRLVLGAAQGIVLAAACVFALKSANSASGAGRASAVFLGVCVAWAATSAVGGPLFEGARSGSDSLIETFGGSLGSLGITENVANVVVPYALLVPALYGAPTGLTFSRSIVP